MPPDPQALAAMQAGGSAALGAPTVTDAAAGGQTMAQPEPKKKAPPKRSAKARYGKKVVVR